MEVNIHTKVAIKYVNSVMIVYEIEDNYEFLAT